ncbi:MAG: hypothetical protein LRY73_18550 [Bacillus sp. (in: Bacteria)]|nr:hypothetical protein [Bacillus sp. (in: firmicutes)]
MIISVIPSMLIDVPKTIAWQDDSPTSARLMGILNKGGGLDGTNTRT